MRILYSGIFGAAMMKPISCGGFWAGFFAVLLLIPSIMEIREIIRYFRLMRHGESCLAEISRTHKYGAIWRRRYHKEYFYSVEGHSFSGAFMTGRNLKRYADKQKFSVYYDKDDPEKHVIPGGSLYTPIILLIYCGLPFAGLLYIFILELRKCF